MPQIQLTCPSCSTEFQASESGVNRPAKCPNCGTKFQASAAPAPTKSKSQSTAEGADGGREGDYVNCPFCRRQIWAIAKKCRYCGEDVDISLWTAEDIQRVNERRPGASAGKVDDAASVEAANAEADDESSGSSRVFGYIALAFLSLFVIAMGVVAYFIINDPSKKEAELAKLRELEHRKELEEQELRDRPRKRKIAAQKQLQSEQNRLVELSKRQVELKGKMRDAEEKIKETEKFGLKGPALADVLEPYKEVIDSGNEEIKRIKETRVQASKKIEELQKELKELKDVPVE